ncbi:MAG TPA: hypothetical protein PKJ24_02150 [Prolixibacteraceae bacterium]|nr:hypothetical protein [Prolixibacteraceae bacterium]
MNQSIWIFSLLFLLVLTPVSAKDPVKNKVDWAAFLSQHDMVWEELPLQWNEGAFVGNGQLGMMVYATLKENRIDFHLGRQDVTDHRKAPGRKTSMGEPGANVMYDFPRLDIGRMALYPKGRIISGKIRLDLWNAELRGEIVTDMGKIAFRAWTPYTRMVNIIEVTSEGGESISPAGFNWKFLPGNPASPRAQVFPDNKESKDYVTNPRHEWKTIRGVKVCVQPLLAGGDYATAWLEKVNPGKKSSTVVISTANEVPARNKSEITATETVLEAFEQNVSVILKEHRDWWHAFYQKSFLSVPGTQIESFYWIQLYKMGSACRADGPALDLFGPWFRVSQWPGLWWNLNVQLTYWPFYPTNHPDLAQNLIDLIDVQFDALLRQYEGPKLGDFAWAMHNYWLHYRYLGDWKAIREKWLPKAIKVAEAFGKLTEKRENGKIGLVPMGSPEYKGFATFPDTNYNLAILRWLLRSLIEVCGKADLHPSELSSWKEMLSALVPYPVDENGLMIGSNQPVDMSHRHYSHLLALYPLFQLDPDSPVDRELVDKSVVHWHRIGGGKQLAGYSYTGAASLYAALGRGNDAHDILHHFLNGNIGISQLLPNTLYVESGGRNPVIETPLSAVASITEMLLQGWGNKIRIFPAVPDSWQNCVFQNLQAQGGFAVSASREKGKTIWVAVESLAGEKCTVKIPGWENAFQISKGRKMGIRYLGNHEFELDLKAGEKVVLSDNSNTIPLVTPVEHAGDEKNPYGVKKGKALKNDQSWPLPEYK